MKLEELEKKLGYHFQNRRLLEQALCHSSYANERHMDRLLNNERLEFLGDAVLELATSEYLYLNYPQMPEGEATRTRRADGRPRERFHYLRRYGSAFGSCLSGRWFC